MYSEICSYKNLELAFKKARKGKTTKNYVVEFEKNLKENLLRLQTELLFHTYKPQPLKTFILRDPKTRKISVSDFKDRIVHHALCNVIAPLFEKSFIHDSFANQKGKGTLKAINRFDYFKRKVANNFSIAAYVLKADVKSYFENVNHNILISIVKRRINNMKVLWLIKKILSNHNINSSQQISERVGMPLGNLTSQFFANVYLNEFDQFVKHKLRVKYYIRYVDDFVILSKSKEKLKGCRILIKHFLEEKLKLTLHPQKSKIIPLHIGTEFLGLKIFKYHKLIKKKNIRKFNKQLKKIIIKYNQGLINYDKIYDFLEGWVAYAKHSDTYNLRKNILNYLEKNFTGFMSTKEINRLK